MCALPYSAKGGRRFGPLRVVLLRGAQCVAQAGAVSAALWAVVSFCVALVRPRVVCSGCPGVPRGIPIVRERSGRRCEGEDATGDVHGRCRGAIRCLGAEQSGMECHSAVMPPVLLRRTHPRAECAPRCGCGCGWRQPLLLGVCKNNGTMPGTFAFATVRGVDGRVQYTPGRGVRSKGVGKEYK